MKENNKFWSDWLFPFIAYFMFATLLATLLVQLETVSLSQLIAYSASPLAYSLMLVGLFIASKPRIFEQHIGMPKMYETHALMTVLAAILVFVHIGNFWQGFGAMFRSPATFWGYIGAFGILLGLLTGALSLSGMFINNNRTLRNLKENFFNREVMLWLHRIGAFAAIIGTYLQNYYIDFLRNNTPYMTLLTIYTVAVIGYYLFWRLQVATGRRYKVAKIFRGTPSLWVLEFEPVDGTIPEYEPGEYFNIRFKGADISGEAHPFSTSSAHTKRFSNSIEFMIKDAGDWTESLQNIEVGDVATLEGPNGDFFPEDVKNSNEEETPFILLAGGIGLTPNLSVLRHEIEIGSQREIHLVWGLSYEEDMFMLDELEAMKKVNPNFQYHIIFSNEEVEGYPFGFISNDFLEEVGADHYSKGHFFVCGPEPMINASKRLLENGNVAYEQQHIDDFGF